MVVYGVSPIGLVGLMGLMGLMVVVLSRHCPGIGVAAEWLNVSVMYRLCIGYVSVMLGS